MSLSCREDRMMICGNVLRQHRNVTDDRRHPRVWWRVGATCF